MLQQIEFNFFTHPKGVTPVLTSVFELVAGHASGAIFEDSHGQRLRLWSDLPVVSLEGSNEERRTWLTEVWKALGCWPDPLEKLYDNVEFCCAHFMYASDPVKIGSGKWGNRLALDFEAQPDVHGQVDRLMATKPNLGRPIQTVIMISAQSLGKAHDKAARRYRARYEKHQRLASGHAARSAAQFDSLN